MPLKRSADENSTERILTHIKDILLNFIATEHIYIDISANSAPISVEYSYYTSCTLMDVLCEYGVIWIKTDRAFH